MLEVRLASHEELPIVHALMLEAFEEFRDKLDPPTGALKETLADVEAAATQGGAFLAFWDGLPVGTGRYLFQGDHVYCGRLAVKPDYRGRGIAKALLDRIEQVAKEAGYPEVRLATREVMQDNVRLYTSRGYEVVEVSEHQSGGGNVRCLLWR